MSVPDVVLPFEQLLDLLDPLLAVGERISRDCGYRPQRESTTQHEEFNMSDSQVIRTDDAPAPAHTFSQGIRKGGLLQVSGQGPMDPATNTYIGEGDVRVQTRRTLENVKAILAAGGAGVEMC